MRQSPGGTKCKFPGALPVELHVDDLNSPGVEV